MSSTKDQRDSFSPKVRDVLAKRASYICSNHDCRAITVAASSADPESFLYVGRAAHITGAAPGGPRYDSSLSPQARSSPENGIFLCANCAEMIDRNSGVDFPATTLRAWKRAHEAWVRSNLNKSAWAHITTIEGFHAARGVGDVTGLDIEGPAAIRPGTISTAEGIGTVTATRIRPSGGKKK